MAGALKNVYAIAVGMGYSLGIGENTRAMVIARAVREMSKLGEAMGGHRDTFAGLAGMGDLIVTCTSQRSRNRHVGEQLGAGKSIDEIIESMNQVAEGVKAASVIMEFADKYGLNMPIAREVDGVINHGSTVEEAYRGLAAEKPGPRGARLGVLSTSVEVGVRALGPVHQRVDRADDAAARRAITKPAWFLLSTHVVKAPSVPQLKVWKLMRESAGSGLTSPALANGSAATLEKTGTPPIAPLTMFAPSGRAGNRAAAAVAPGALHHARQPVGRPNA